MSGRTAEARSGRQNVEDVYPLSPLQQGILFHSINTRGAYVEQLAMELHGPLHVAELRRAWQGVVDRHPVLRTGFVWKNVPAPMQVVHRAAGLPFRLLDWTDARAEEREARISALLADDRAEGYDLARPPLLRITLAKTGPADHFYLITFHHLLIDGWSLPIILSEMGALYDAELARTPVHLPRPRPFRDYVAWLQRQDHAHAEAYWRASLAGVSAPTPLPLDTASPSASALAGEVEEHAVVETWLPEDVSAALHELARAEKVTLNTLVQGAWALLLSRYSGQEQVVYGTTAAGRPAELPGVEQMVGLFINTLPVAVAVPPRERVRQWLAGLQHRQAEQRDYEFVRLGDVHTWSGFPRDVPMFGSLLVFENYPGLAALAHEPGEEELRMTVRQPLDRTNYPLTLVAGAPAGGPVLLRMTYDARRYDEPRVRRLLEGVSLALRGFAAAPDAALGDVDLVTAEERAQVAAWNAESARSYPAERVHRLVEAQAARAPDAPAILWDREVVSYRELDERANRLAHHLRGLGVGAESSVGVCLDRTPELIVAMLAVLKAGGAYVPLDPAYPAARIGFMLADSGARVVVTRGDLASRIPSPEAVAVVSVDGDAEAIAGHPSTAPEDAGDLAQRAYVIYTSGSTGMPKGVEIEHRATAAFLAWMRERFPLWPGDRVLASTSVSFDVSVAEIHHALACGATLVLVENALALADAGFGDFAGLAQACMAPAAAAELVRADAIPFGLRRMILGGEALPAALARDLHDLGVGEVVNGYGPTEDTTYSTISVVPADAERVGIGRPVGGGRAYVLDGALRPVPVGAPGELYVAGAGVARGYLRRPALTAERFLPDVEVAGARMYRTGDLARWTAEGELEYLGRTDFQAKVRGFRVETGEVEAALARHPSVAACAVAVRDDLAGGAGLAAYVVPSAGAPFSAPALRDFLAESLPEFMLPAAFVSIATLPLTPSGKLDRRALPAPGASAAADVDDVYAAPAAGVEEMLAAVWAALLRVERVGARDSFFALGGHSLVATQLVSRVREVFGVELPLRAVFEAPTVAALARRIRALLAGDAADAAPPLVAREMDGEAPASFAQERLWVIDQLEPGSAAYNMAEAIRLRGELDVAALERTFGEIVRRHAVLRTTFAARDGRPVQVIHPAAELRIPVDDVSARADAEAEARRIVDDEASTGFDLEAGPLLRLRIVRLAERDHVLSIVLHHIVGDAWSAGVLVREMGALYQAFRAGGSSPLPELPVQYADFAAWQRDWLEGGVLARQVEFWRAELAGAPTVLELPADRPRPPVQTYAGAEHRFALPESVATRLREAARKEGATLYMALLGAFQLLLARYSGQSDLLVGTPIANRTRGETEGLIGFFTNTLAVRARLDGDPTFRELLARLRERLLAAYAHQDLPFERLVEALGVERSLSRSPLFQVMFALNNAAGGEGLSLGGLEMERFGREVGTSRFDLTLILTEGGDGLEGVLEYSTDLFDSGTAARLAAHFTALLEQVAERPDARAGELELLSEDERRRVIDEWNATDADFGGPATVVELFDAAAARTPDAVAVSGGAEQLTYAELAARADALARRLRSRGVGPDVPVAIALPRSPEMAVAVLAVLKAGGCYVALDPAYPRERLEVMLGDSGAAVLLTTTELSATLPASPAAVLLADAAEEDGVGGDAEGAEASASPDDLAYILYTSGSTGRPKGVALPHRALANMVRWQVSRWAGEPPAATLQFASLSFDVSFQEMFATWCSGGRLVLVDEETRRDPAALLGHLAAHGVERIFLPFAALQALAEAAEGADLAGVRLREIVTAGEQLQVTPSLVHLARSTGARLENQYGPTEAHVVSAHRLEGDAERWPALPPIGAPIANARTYVLDAEMRPAPVGVRGELYLAGEGLARGYLRRPALTAAAFVPCPFGPAGARMYRTGDRARWLADGTLRFLGRADEQAKVRGFRVEPGEVEAAVRAHPAVRDAAVAVRGEGAARRLVAWVVAADGPVDADGVKDFLRARLPDFMVPAAVVEIGALPLTPSGKVDRRALPEPDAAFGDGFVEPATETELRVAEIWREVLGVERISADADFFALGGHSLLATRVVSRIRRALSVSVPLRVMFEHPTVRRLAAHLQSLAAAGDDAITAAPQPPRDQPAPLSFGQERMWVVDRLDPGSPAYNMPGALRIHGALDAAALERALGGIIARHEPLRTTFAERDRGPEQVIHPAAAFHLPYEDLSALPEGAREAELRRRTDAEARTPFDLGRGPMFRARLLRLAEDEHALLFTLHHIAADGWSIGIFLREMTALYEAFAAGLPSPLPPLPLRYADFAAAQRSRLSGAAMEGELAYWRGALAGAPPLLELPADRPRPAVQSLRGASYVSILPPEVVQPLRAATRARAGTLFMGLLAAFQLLLSRWSGQDDVVVGVPVAGRTDVETEGLIGLFLNTLPLRARVSGDDTFASLLTQVRDTTLGAFAHQDLPFEKIVEEVQPERSLAHHPLYQVLFSLQNTPSGALRLGDAELEVVDSDAGAARLDLSLSLQELSDGGLHASVEYSTALFDRETVERLVSQYAALLADAAVRADAPVADLAPLAGEEREMVLRRWNDTAVPYPRDATLHALFQLRAAEMPGEVALVHRGESITYGELNARANRLARTLIERGVRPGGAVGLAMGRSPEAVVTMAAALKAGAAYVPLDTAYPAERLAYMIAQAHVSALVVADEVPAALAGYAGPVVSLAADAAEVAAQADADLPELALATSLAHVIFTSGSTGHPKGVALSHRSTARLVCGSSFCPIAPGDAVFHGASIAFDAAGAEIWGALVNGARAVILPAGARSLEEIGTLIRTAGVTHAYITAGLWHQVVDERLDDLRALRFASIGGDVMSVRHAARVLRELPELSFHNSYGPTENGVISTIRRLTAADVERPTVPIGGALENSRVYVVDAALRPVHVGIPGELLVAGDGLADGYVGREDLTAERFVTVDFGDGIIDRVYRTGDRARWLPDGGLEFLGRLDTQVKVRGFRIEPGEVETALAALPLVASAVVIAREDAPGDRRLVAYVTPHPGGEVPSGDDLRAALRSTLPDYMVPAAVVVLDELPITAHGKVDRRALPAPAWTREETYVAPATPLEARLAELWQEILGVERAGAEDDFFASGGHSLLATRLVSAIRRAFAVELPLRAVFEHATLRRLAAALAEAGAAVTADGDGDDAMKPAPRDGRIPLSFAQERMWFLDRLDPGSSAYSIPAPLRLRGELDAVALERALGELVRRHESLRTRFAADARGPVQVIDPARPLHLRVIDLSHLPEWERQAEARRRMDDDAQTGFDLERGPLFRAGLIRMGADEHLLLLNVHHAVSDGWSFAVVMGELGALYAAYSRGEPSPLPEPRLQYADFAAWQRSWLTPERVERQVAWWRGQLEGAPPRLELPTDHPRPPVQGHRGEAETLLIPRALVESLRTLGHERGATLAMTALAAFQLLLGRLAGQDDVVVGAPIAGRTRVETEGMVGLFLNTLALRTRLDGEPTFAALLERVRETMLGAYAHQDVPFERLLEDLKPERSLSWSPVFQVMFNMLNLKGGAGVEQWGLEIEGAATDMEMGSKVDLTVYAQEQHDGLLLRAAYDPDLFTRGRMAEMLRQYAAVLEQAAAAPDLPIGRLSLRTVEARAALPDPAEPLPDAWRGSVPGLFAHWAARTPDALAAADPRERWTYAELDAASSRIANRLIAAGVRPGDAVAIWARRDAALVRALLGTMKAGAAFVVLDPAYPAARLARYAAVARPAALLRIAAAGPVPAEVEDALASTVRCAIALGGRAGDAVDDADALASISTEAPSVDLTADSLAYLAFTSGTTGDAKAVMGRHGSLTHFTPWMAETFALTAADRFSMLSGLAHDPLQRDVFIPLQLGGAVIAPDPEQVGAPGYLARWLADERVTVANLTPAMGQLIADTAGNERISTLRRAFVVGDVLLRADVERLRRIAPHLAVVNLYGATESQRAISYHVVLDDAESGASPVVPLGRGMPGVQLLVRNAAGEMCGVGEVGEIWMRSPHLAAGYLGDAALTAARFVANPFTTVPGDMLYRTGDLGRYRPDGVVEPLGRADQQVKVRGFRVELGEIEAALAAHPAVREAVAGARGDAGARRLVAWVVPADAAAGVDAEALRAHLRASVPEYMVPPAFVALDHLPLTPNGKVDRRALPEPDAAPEAAYVPPSTAAEQVMAEIWAEVLGADRVGVEDNFFALGGHSLLATQVLSRIDRAFAVKLPVRTLFEHPTVASLAAAVEASGEGLLAGVEEELEGLSDEELMALLAEVEEA